MPFQPVPDVALITIEGRVDGQLTINDLYFAVSGSGIDPVNLATITNAVGDWAANTLLPLLSNQWTLVRARGVDLTVETGPAYERAYGLPGEVSGEAVPNNVAACVSFRTASRGRSFRGRNYVPGIPNAEVTLNTISNTLINNLVDGYQQLAGAGTFQAGWEWVVVSRKTGGNVRPEGIPSPIITVVMTTPYVRSMRSREVGHGA